MSRILGISAFYHDSAACILNNGKIVAAAQEERFTRKKHDASYPKNAIKFVLDFANLKLSEVDQIVFFEKPFLKFERLLETMSLLLLKGLSHSVKLCHCGSRKNYFKKTFYLINLKNTTKIINLMKIYFFLTIILVMQRVLFSPLHLKKQ